MDQIHHLKSSMSTSMSNWGWAMRNGSSRSKKNKNEIRGIEETCHTHSSGGVDNVNDDSVLVVDKRPEIVGRDKVGGREINGSPHKDGLLEKEHVQKDICLFQDSSPKEGRSSPQGQDSCPTSPKSPTKLYYGVTGNERGKSSPYGSVSWSSVRPPDTMGSMQRSRSPQSGADTITIQRSRSPQSGGTHQLGGGDVDSSLHDNLWLGREGELDVIDDIPESAAAWVAHQEAEADILKKNEKPNSSSTEKQKRQIQIERMKTVKEKKEQKRRILRERATVREREKRKANTVVPPARVVPPQKGLANLAANGLDNLEPEEAAVNIGNGDSTAMVTENHDDSTSATGNISGSRNRERSRKREASRKRESTGQGEKVDEIGHQYIDAVPVDRKHHELEAHHYRNIITITNYTNATVQHTESNKSSYKPNGETNRTAATAIPYPYESSVLSLDVPPYTNQRSVSSLDDLPHILPGQRSVSSPVPTTTADPLLFPGRELSSGSGRKKFAANGEKRTSADNVENGDDRLGIFERRLISL